LLESGAIVITGERRPFKRGKAAFDRVEPARSLTETGGWGAWELAFRVSELRHDDFAPGPDPALTTFMMALNWYPLANARVMLDYVRARADAGGAQAPGDIVQGRVQVDF
jgi:phosphate-selective porin